MTITQDARYHDTSRLSTVESGPTFSGLDILGGIVAVVMVLGPLTAAGTHASHQGWPTEQSQTR
jgi:hypothetical protein